MGAQPVFKVRTISSRSGRRSGSPPDMMATRGFSSRHTSSSSYGEASLSATRAPRWQWWHRALQLWVSSKEAHQGRRSM